MLFGHKHWLCPITNKASTQCKTIKVTLCSVVVVLDNTANYIALGEGHCRISITEVYVVAVATLL